MQVSEKEQRGNVRGLGHTARAAIITAMMFNQPFLQPVQLSLV